MKLSRWRRKEGKTQQWVADQVGCDQSFISNVERTAKPAIPGPEFMRAVYILTRGQVRPDDFYDVPEWEAARIQQEAEAEISRRDAA